MTDTRPVANLRVGCVRSKDGTQFTPIIFEAHQGVYICSELFLSPIAAMDFATFCIPEEVYKHWHYHKLEG